MTGLLAVSGIVLVLLASAYSGLSGTETESLSPALEITPAGDGDSNDALEVDATATPEPPAEAPPPVEPTPIQNREDCVQIRGTDYFSPQERTWFLENCVNN